MSETNQSNPNVGRPKMARRLLGALFYPDALVKPFQEEKARMSDLIRDVRGAVGEISARQAEHGTDWSSTVRKYGLTTSQAIKAARNLRFVAMAGLAGIVFSIIAFGLFGGFAAQIALLGFSLHSYFFAMWRYEQMRQKRLFPARQLIAQIVAGSVSIIPAALPLGWRIEDNA